MPVDDSNFRIQAAWQRLARLGTLPAIDERIREAAGISLSRTERAVLAQLRDRGSIRISELAHLMGLDVSTMSRTLRRLADAGLIERRPGSDLRAVRISLTRAGETALTKMLRSGQDLISEMLAEWAASDRTLLAELMSRFADSFAEHLMPPTPEIRREEEVHSDG